MRRSASTRTTAKPRSSTRCIASPLRARSSTHDPSADANYNNYKWGFSYSTHPFVGGGIGGEDYTNAVWGMGINWGTSGNSRLDATRAAVGWVLESKYYPGSGSFYQSEAHLQFYDAAGVGHRMLSGALPHTGTTGSIFAIQSDVVNFLKWDGTQKVKLDLANDAFSFVGQLVWSVDTNNYHFLRQKNAANSAYVNLLFLDNLDRVRIEAPVFIFSTPESTTGHLLRVQPSSITTGQTAIAAILPDMTGQAYAFQSTGRSSTGMDIALFNNDATNGTAYSRLQLRTFNASSGDPYVLFNINGVTTYSLGIDNSDSDAFVLSKASTLGSNNRVRIDDNSIQLMLPPKVPSYTVAGVPSASTLGAGSIIYVSNEFGRRDPRLLRRHELEARLRPCGRELTGRTEARAGAASRSNINRTCRNGERPWTRPRFQRALIHQGFDLGPFGADGAMGPLTRRAIAEFEAKHGLKADGEPDSAFIKTLLGSAAETPWFPWYAEAERRMGLNENRDKVELSTFLKSDGSSVGDPTKLPWCGDFVETCMALSLPRRAITGEPLSGAKLAEVRRRVRADRGRGARVLARFQDRDIGPCRVLRRRRFCRLSRTRRQPGQLGLDRPHREEPAPRRPLAKMCAAYRHPPRRSERHRRPQPERSLIKRGKTAIPRRRQKKCSPRSTRPLSRSSWPCCSC